MTEVSPYGAHLSGLGVGLGVGAALMSGAPEWMLYVFAAVSVILITLSYAIDKWVIT